MFSIHKTKRVQAWYPGVCVIAFLVLLPFAGAQAFDCLSPLHVEGKWVLDEAGNEVTLHGINIYLETHIRTPQAMLGQIDAAADGKYGGSGIVRLCIYAGEEMLKTSNKDIYEKWVRPAVDRCRQKKLYIEVEPHHFPNKTDWAVKKFGSVDAQLKWHEDFWHYMAPRLKDEEHVLFGCANEPFGDCQTVIRPWMIELVDIIRSYDTAADNIIIVQGGGSWGHEIDCYNTHPIDRPNIMYEKHRYGATGENKMADFNELLQKHPGFIGEWHWLYINHEDIGVTLADREQWFKAHPNCWSTYWTQWERFVPNADMKGFFSRINTRVPMCGPAQIRACMEADVLEGSQPLTVNFNAACSQASEGANLDSYSWDFGGAQSGSGVQATHTFTTEGQHSVILTVHDDNGQTDQVTQTIEVLPSLIPGIVRINAGGDNLTDSRGNFWIADAHFTGGNNASKPQVDIVNSEIDELFYTERYGMDSYSIPVSNGNHTVRLFFCEQYGQITGAGQRVFDISVEGTEVSGFDVYQEAGGRQKAVVKEFPVSVNDGTVDILFTQDVQSTMINGIEVVAESAVEVMRGDLIRENLLRNRSDAVGSQQLRVFSIQGKHLGNVRSLNSGGTPSGVYIIENGSMKAGRSHRTKCEVR